ncbi:hypothetical protein, partial [Bradyrhizobium sp. P5_C11_2]
PLSPLAGRGRILRAAENSGEGDSPRVHLLPYARHHREIARLPLFCLTHQLLRERDRASSAFRFSTVHGVVFEFFANRRRASAH